MVRDQGAPLTSLLPSRRHLALAHIACLVVRGLLARLEQRIVVLVCYPLLAAHPAVLLGWQQGCSGHPHRLVSSRAATHRRLA